MPLAANAKTGRCRGGVDTKGGIQSFAADASNSCQDVESRHLRELETGVFSAMPQGGCEPEAVNENPDFCACLCANN
jgi:hypothetical protein